jgi:hypothetical protein
MPCLDENQRLRAIGMLQAGLAQNVVAKHFGCHRNTILSLYLCEIIRVDLVRLKVIIFFFSIGF